MNIILKKPFIYLALLSFGTSICFTFQLSNLSTLFKFLGADHATLPWLWLAPPLTGLLVQPIIGQLSDDTNTRFGKRQPYILAGALSVALSFILLTSNPSLTMAIVLTLVIDCGLNSCSEGLRALTGDQINKDERSSAFAIQAILGGIGGAIGAGLTYFFNTIIVYFGMPTDILTAQLPIHFKYAFVFCAFVLLITVLIGLIKLPVKPFKKHNLLNIKHSQLKSATPINKVIPNLLISIKKMPLKFKSICFVHALTWTSIFIFWLYLPIVVAQNFFHLSPAADVTANPIYAETLNKASLLTAKYLPIYLYTSVIYSIVLYFISMRFNKTILHMHALFIGGIGLIAASFTHSLVILSLALIAIGIMWGSLIVLPYALVMEIFPKGKMGVYLGIFNISITIPQIICSLSLPIIYKYLFHSNAEYVLCLGGGLMILSAIGWFILATKKINTDATVRMIKEETAI